ncbi:MAG: hypothetical protein WDN48_07390 [Pseudolabrys sp.]
MTIAAGYVYARFNAASDPTVVLSVGFVLIVAIYVQTAILFGVYTPELFPTEIRCAPTASATRSAAAPRWCRLSLSPR